MTVYQTAAGPDMGDKDDQDGAMTASANDLNLLEAEAAAAEVETGGGGDPSADNPVEAESRLHHLHHHPGLLMEDEDPVLMSSNKDPTEDPADALMQLADETDSAFGLATVSDRLADVGSGSGATVQFSLDDLASFAHPFSHVPTDGSHASFDTSIETASFLSGTLAGLDDTEV